MPEVKPLNIIGLQPKTATRDKGKKRVAIILEVAKEIFALEGYHNFTLRKIARKADLHIASLQHYFSSKEDLLRAVIDQELTYYDQEWEKCYKKTIGNPVKRLETILQFQLDLHLDQLTSGFVFQFWALACTNEVIHGYMSNFYEDFIEKLIDILKSACPDLPEEELRKRALAIMSLVEGTMIFIGGGRRILCNCEDVRGNAVAQAMKIACFPLEPTE